MSLPHFALLALAAAALPAQATIAVNDSSFSYTQTFDSLTSSTAVSPWINDSTLAGWSLFSATGAPIASYSANDGGSNAGSFRSFGAAGSSDRALGGVASGGAYFGSPASGAVAGWIAAAFTNTGSTSLASVTLAFDGEQWRNGGNTAAQSMVLEYGFGASFASVSQWNAPGGSFDWSSPVTGSTSAAVDGNGSGLTAARGGTISNLGWNPGDTLWLRWTERNDTGNDHGLAIDNLSLSVSAVPEPSSYALLLAGLGAVALISRRRTRRQACQA